MIGNLKYFSISLASHVLLIGTIFIFVHLNSTTKKEYLTVANKGASFAVNIVNNMSNPKPTINKSHKNPNKIKKDVKNYPESKKAKIKLTQNTSSTKNNNLPKIVQKNNGSGGKYGKNAEVVPVMKNTNVISYVAPEYPKRALILGEEGTVIVRLLVNENGKIVANKLYKSSGHRLLDNAVVKVAKLWSVNNPPVRTSWVEIVVNFIIR